MLNRSLLSGAAGSQSGSAPKAARFCIGVNRAQNRPPSRLFHPCATSLSRHGACGLLGGWILTNTKRFKRDRTDRTGSVYLYPPLYAVGSVGSAGSAAPDIRPPRVRERIHVLQRDRVCAARI